MSEYTNEKRTYVAGYVTAYGAAKRGGYTGTYDDFCADMAHLAGITAQATTLDAGEPATASYDDGVLSLGIPKGDKGEKGDDGGLSAEAIANEYDPFETYAIGDYCISDGALYKCVVKIATPEEWTAAHWTAISMTEEVSDLKAATLIPSAASGSIASFPDGADLPVRGLEVGIEPVQDLHGYGNPWPAGGGKNLLDPSKRTVYSSGRGQRWYETDGFVLKANQAYTFSVTYANPIALYIIDKTSTNVLVSSNNSVSYTPTADVAVYFQAYRGEDISSVDTFQLEKGSTATTYVPYSNICPITGWTGANVWRTGKNLLEPRFYRGVDYNKRVGQYVLYGAGLVDITESITTSGNTFSQTGSSWGLSMCLVVDVGRLTGKQIRVSGTFTGDLNVNNGLKSSWYFTDENYIVTRVAGAMNINPPYVLTPAEGEKYLIWYINSSASGTITLDSPMVELGSTATSYEPYQGTTLPISWQSEAGTVYGGSLDVTDGVLVVDRAIKHLSEATNWQGPVALNDGSGYYIYATNFFDSTQANKNAISNVYKKNNAAYVWEILTFGECRMSTTMIATVPPEANTLALAVEYLSTVDAYVVYYLAAPLTIQLTPSTLRTLYGQNNVWADTGDIAVDYYADTKLYIEKLTAPTEDDMVANSNIQSGKYFMVGNALYLSTAAIAANETIKPGTNCTRVSLADALNSLNA